MEELSQTRLWQMLAGSKSSLHKLARLPYTLKFNSLSVFHTHGCLDRRRPKDKKILSHDPTANFGRDMRHIA